MNGGSLSRVAIFHILATCLDAKGGCNSGEYGDDYFEDFTPDSFVFVFHYIKFKFYKWYFNSLPLFEGTPSKTEGEPIDSISNCKVPPLS